MNLQCMTAGILYVGRGREKKTDRRKKMKEQEKGEKMERKKGGSKRKPGRIRVKIRERGEGEDTLLDLPFHLDFIYCSKNKSTYIPNNICPNTVSEVLEA